VEVRTDDRKKAYQEYAQKENLELPARIEALLDILKIECVEELQNCAQTLNFDFTSREFFNYIIQESKLYLYEQDLNQGLDDAIDQITNQLKKEIEDEIMDLDPRAIDYEKVSGKSPEWLQRAAKHYKKYGPPESRRREKEPSTRRVGLPGETPTYYDEPSTGRQYVGIGGPAPGGGQFDVGANIPAPKKPSLWDKFKKGAYEFLGNESTKQEIQDLLVEAGMGFQDTLQRIKSIIDQFGEKAKRIIKGHVNGLQQQYDIKPKEKPEVPGSFAQDVGSFSGGSTQDVMSGGMPEEEEPEVQNTVDYEEKPTEEEEIKHPGRKKLTPEQRNPNQRACPADP